MAALSAGRHGISLRVYRRKPAHMGGPNTPEHSIMESVLRWNPHDRRQPGRCCQITSQQRIPQPSPRLPRIEFLDGTPSRVDRAPLRR